MGTGGLVLGGLLLVMGLSAFTGGVDLGNLTDGGVELEVQSFRGAGALILFPLFLILFFGLVRDLPSNAKKTWILKNLPEVERNKLECKFDLEDK